MKLTNVSTSFLQLTNEPHMSHGMFNFDYKVIIIYLVFRYVILLNSIVHGAFVCL